MEKKRYWSKAYHILFQTWWHMSPIKWAHWCLLMMWLLTEVVITTIWPVSADLSARIQSNSYKMIGWCFTVQMDMTLNIMWKQHEMFWKQRIGIFLNDKLSSLISVQSSMVFSWQNWRQALKHAATQGSCTEDLTKADEFVHVHWLQTTGNH